MFKTAALIAISFFICFSSFGQKAIINGKLSDSTENRDLHYAVISLLRVNDTTLAAFTRTDATGRFSFLSADTGQYLILVTYPHFADYMDRIEVRGNTELGTVYLTPTSKLLDEVVIRTGTAIRIKGDTTEFTADSFKVREGATVEELLKKLPGFTVNSKGEIVAQGKRVDKVLVDGEEFFGDDPTMATHNISAKAVDKVQVFDTKSEQQNITGMTTGNEGKTVNIKLKEDSKKGSFGRFHTGTDFDQFIDAKALFNRFVGKKKFSVYGTRTNTNAGSLSWEDRQKIGIENDMEYDELSGYYFSFGSGDDFNDWNLRGLPDAYTAGALYADKWNADKHNLNISYRFNSLGTTNNGTTFTQNVLPTGLTYTNRYSTKDALNRQHAVNGKYEWKFDSLASLKLVTSHTYKTSHTIGADQTAFLGDSRDSINYSSRNYDNSTRRNQTDNQLTYKQMFNKKNRLWQTVFRFGITDDYNTGLNNTNIRYYDNGNFDYADTIDQQKMFDGRSTTLGVKTTFSEPLSDVWTLVFDYAFNKNHSVSKRNTYEKDFNGKYDVLIDEFSNNFELDASSHSSNAILRFFRKKIRMGFGTGISSIRLGLQDLDNNITTPYRFTNFTPQFQFNFSPKQQTNYSFSYRGNTRQPTINQLQPLRDNTDPLNEYIGNPDLKVGFNHGFTVNHHQYKVLKQVYTFLYFSYNIQDNAITQFNTIDAQGKRTYKPVNVDGNSNWNFGGNYNKDRGDKKLKYGVNVNANGGRYASFVNGVKVTNNNFATNLNLNIGIDNSDKYSFNINPSIGYNKSRSSLATSMDNNYFTYGGRVNMEVKLPWKMEVRSNLNVDLRQKIRAFANNTNLVIWHAEISKKFLKKDAGKLSLVANDILDENKGFTRTITNTFITDDRFQRVSRYFLLRFEWSFNNMSGGNSK